MLFSSKQHYLRLSPLPLIFDHHDDCDGRDDDDDDDGDDDYDDDDDDDDDKKEEEGVWIWRCSIDKKREI